MKKLLKLLLCLLLIFSSVMVNKEYVVRAEGDEDSEITEVDTTEENGLSDPLDIINGGLVIDEEVIAEEEVITESEENAGEEQTVETVVEEPTVYETIKQELENIPSYEEFLLSDEKDAIIGTASDLYDEIYELLSDEEIMSLDLTKIEQIMAYALMNQNPVVMSDDDDAYWASLDRNAKYLSIRDGITDLPEELGTSFNNLKAIYLPASVITMTESLYNALNNKGVVIFNESTISTGAEGVYYFTPTSNGTYKFTGTNGQDSWWYSNNISINSSTATTTWTTYLPKSVSYSIPWNVSSEQNYDKFSLTVNGQTKVNGESGVKSATVDLTLNAGTNTIIASYSKDGSVNSNSDRAGIYLGGITTSVTLAPNQLSATDFEYWTNFNDNSSNVVIPEGITTVFPGALNDLPNMKTIYIPNTVTKIYSDASTPAFAGCNSLEKIYTNATSAPSGWGTYWKYTSSSVTVPVSFGVSLSESEYWSSLDKNATSIVIPSTVSFIPSNSFDGFANLEKIVVSDSVRKIDKQAFKDLTSLKYIYIPSTVTTIVASSSADSPLAGCGSSVRIMTDAVNKNSGWGSYWYGSSLSYVTYGISVAEFNYWSAVTDQAEIELPEYIAKIPTRAFYNFSNLESVTFNSADIVINEYAFYGCSSLASLNNAEAIKEIGNYAFATCSSLTTYNFPNCVSIGNFAFNGCNKLANITLGSKLTSIGSGAFSNCYSLKRLFIPENVVTINAANNYNYVFNGCTSLTISTSYSSKPSGWGQYWDYTGTNARLNVLWGVTPDELDYWDTLDRNKTVITIPDYVTYIPADAFENNTTVTEVILPAGLKKIGNNAFKNCTNLSTIDLSHVSTIGSYAFAGCTSLTSVEIHSVSALTAATSAFEGCTSLETLTVPIEATCAKDCFKGSDLKTVHFVASSTGFGVNYSTSDTADKNDRPWYQNNVTSVIFEEGIKSIGNDTFDGCAYLTNVQLPSTLTDIGVYAFANCTNIQSLSLPNDVATIGYGAFNNCSSLNTFVLPQNITKLDSYNMLYDCGAIGEIYIPASLTNINENVFNGVDVGRFIVDPANPVYDSRNNCGMIIETATNTLLKASRNGFIPMDIDTIGTEAYRIKGVSSVVIPDCIKEIKSSAFFECSDLKYVSIPDSVTSIGSQAFARCKALEMVDLKTNLTKLPDYIFEGCSALREFEIPNSVITIGASAFSGCSSLDRVAFTSNVTSVSYSAFDKTDSMRRVEIPSLNDWLSITFSYDSSSSHGSNPLECGENAVLYVNGVATTKVTVPSSTTSIKAGAFYGYSMLEEINFPTNLNSIGKYSFTECDNLADVVIPDSCTSVDYNAFNGCSSIRTLSVPMSASYSSGSFGNIKSIEEVIITKGSGTAKDYTSSNYYYTPWYYAGTAHANYSSGITYDDGLTVTIADGVKAIGNYCFYNFDALYRIRIPSSVTSIGTYAFAECDNLHSVYIPSSVTTLGTNAFYKQMAGSQIYDIALFTDKTSSSGWSGVPYMNCGYTIEDWEYWNSLMNKTTVAVKDGVTVLPDCVFAGSKTLEKVIIPDSVTDIGYLTFDNCRYLKEITLPISANRTYDAFAGCTNVRTVNFTKGTGVGANFGSATYNKTPWYLSKTSDITFEEGITSIGKYMFYGETGITSLTLPNSLTSIGDYAFYGCANITDLVYPISALPDTTNSFNGVTNIQKVTITAGTNGIGRTASGTYTYLPWYKSKSTVTDVTIEEGVKSLSYGMFAGLTNVRTFDLPASLMKIDDYVFYGSTGFSSIYIPNTVTTVGVTGGYAKSPFNGCSSGLTIYTNASASLPGWASQWNYRASGSPLTVVYGKTPYDQFWANLKGTETTVIIPNGVTAIPANAFKENTNLKTVVIPSTVTSIGTYAFSGCTNLEDLTMPATLGVTSSTYFENCTSLRKLTLTKGAASGTGKTYTSTTVKYTPWYKTTNDVEVIIEDGVISVGDYTFYNCNKIKKLTVPVDTKYSSSSFSGCTNIAEVVMTKGTTGASAALDTTTRSYTPWSKSLSQCKKITIQEGVVSLNSYYIYSSTGLNEVSLPSTLKTIGTNNFSISGSAIKTINIPSLESWLGIEFKSYTANPCYYATGEKIYIDGVELTDVIIPDTVTKINANAFAGYDNLKRVYIPASVATITASTMSASPFYKCPANAEVYAEASAKQSGWGTYWNYYDSSKYYNVNYSSSKESSYWLTLDRNVSSLTIPEGITYIPDNAFLGNAVLEEITIPGTVTKIGTDAFKNTASLTKVIVDSEKSWLDLTLSNGYANPLSNGKAKLYIGSRTMPATSFTVPKTTTAIKNYAFYGASQLNVITIPEGVTSIGTSAFEGVTGIASLVLPTSLTSIGSRAFYGTSNVTTLTMPISLGATSSNSFANMSSLKTVRLTKGSGVAYAYTSSNYINTPWYANGSNVIDIYIENGVTGLGNYTFRGAASLRSVNIPDSVTTLGSNTFDGCSSLKSLTMPVTLLVPSNTTFGSCTRIENVLLTKGANGVGANYTSSTYHYTPWYATNSSLLKVSLASDVTSIGDYTFYGNSRLTSFTITGNVTSVGNAAFANCYNLKMLTLPVSLGITGTGVFNNSPITTVNVSVGTGVGYNYTTGNYNCAPWSGATVNTISVAEGVTSLGNYYFYNAEDVTKLTLPDSLVSAGTDALKGLTSLEQLQMPVTFKNADGCKFSVSNALTDVRITKGSGIDDESYDNFGYQYKPWYNTTAEMNVVVDEGVKVLPYAYFEYANILEVSLPSTLTKIMSSAFWGNGNLMEVTVPESVRSLGSSVFEYCSSLRSVTLPSRLNDSTFRNGMFYECSALENVRIPDGVTAIGSSAFYGCTNLNEVYIPHTVTSVQNHAFYNCRSLTSLDLSNVTGSGDSAYYNCWNVKDLIIPISASPSTTAYKGLTRVENLTLTKGSGKGQIYSNNSKETSEYTETDRYGNKTYHYPYYQYSPWYNCCQNIKTLTIAEGIESIGAYSFYYNDYASRNFNDVTVVLPQSLRSIGEYAFYNCSYISYLTMPLISAFGYKSFEGVNSIDEITLTQGSEDLPESYHDYYTSTPWYASASYRYGSLKKVTISADLERIPDYMFYWCQSIETIVLPSCLKEIGNFAFMHCEKLSEMSVPDGVETIGQYGLYYCTSLVQDLPAAIRTLGNYAFVKTATTDVHVPARIIKWGDGVFGNRANNSEKYNVQRVYITDLESWLNSDFSMASSNPIYSGAEFYLNGVLLSDVVVPETVTVLKDYALAGYAYLNDLTIPSTVKDVSSWFLYDSYVNGNVYYGGCRNEWLDLYSGETFGGKQVIYTGLDSGVVVEPNCTEEGYTLFTCTHCQETYKDNFKDALGHSDNDSDKLCDVCGEQLSYVTYAELVTYVAGVKDTYLDQTDVIYTDPSLKNLTEKLNAAEAVDENDLDAIQIVYLELAGAVDGLKQYTTLLVVNSDPAGSGTLKLSGRYFAAGETVGLEANAVAGYSFVGWYAGDELISNERLAEYVVRDTDGVEAVLTAKYESNQKVQLEVNASAGRATVSAVTKADGTATSTSVNATTKNLSYSLGTKITVKAVGNNFLYWIDSITNRVVSKEIEYSFYMRENVKLQACYRAIIDETYFVIVRDMNGKDLYTEYVDFGNRIDEEVNEIEHINYAGYNFVGWSVKGSDTIYEKLSDIEIDQDMEITAKYEAIKGLTLMVEGGSVDYAKDSYRYGDIVTVRADESRDGRYFSGWYEGEKLVSDRRDYKFYVVRDVVLVARYDGDEVVTVESKVNLTVSDRKVLDDGKQQIVTYTNWDVLEGKEIVDGGIVFTFFGENGNEDDLVVQNVDNQTIYSSVSVSKVLKTEYVYTFTLGTNSSKKPLYIRSYVRFIDITTGEIDILYTDVICSLPLNS